jgi:hypothetical protein
MKLWSPRRGSAGPTNGHESAAAKVTVTSQNVVKAGWLIRATFVNLKALQTNRWTVRARMTCTRMREARPARRQVLVKTSLRTRLVGARRVGGVGISDRRARVWIRRHEAGEKLIRPELDAASNPETRSVGGPNLRSLARADGGRPHLQNSQRFMPLWPPVGEEQGLIRI